MKNICKPSRRGREPLVCRPVAIQRTAAVRRIPCVKRSGHSPGRKGLFPVIRYSRGCRIIPPQPVPRERRKTDQIFDLSIAYHSPPGESSPNLEFSMNIM